MNPKEFFRRWGEGIKNLPASAVMKARVRAHFWGSIGMAIGLYFVLIKGMWGFSVFIVAMIYLQWWEYRGSLQKFKQIKEMEEGL